MAEALGVVASAISILTLLEQIISTIDKLRSLRHFVKTASNDLQDLIEEIEVVQAVLIALRPESLEFLNLPFTKRRLHAFQKDLEALIFEISKYRDTTLSRRLGAVKLVLKKDMLRVHRQNLDNIKSTLVLLLQAYCSASLRELTLKIDSQNVLPKEETMDSDDDQQDLRFQVARKGRRVKKVVSKQFRFRTPLILVDKMWTINTSHLFSSWTFSIRVNNVVPHESPILLHCREGNIKEIQRLFSAGLASPFDCDPNGQSLIHMAVRGYKLDVCHLLLESGADPSHRNKCGFNPLGYFNFGVALNLIEPREIPLIFDLYRLFISDAEDELFGDNNNNLNLAFRFSGPAEVLTLIQNDSFEKYSELPLKVRFKRTMALNHYLARGPSPAVFRIAMGGEPIDPAAYALEDDYGGTLLHKISEAMAADLAVEETSNIAEWRPLLRDAVLASIDLNKPTHRYNLNYSPFTWFLLTFHLLNSKAHQQARGFNNYILRIWVSELKLAGVDLEAYGAKEHALYNPENDPMEFPLFLKCNRSNYLLPICYHTTPNDLVWWRIISLQYGPEPEDWYLWVANPVDELVGEFWEMIEKSLEVMPGTWTD
ncbi:hypothetical protein BDW59DRAFT_156785 [Aspergillus cavernicola]|uniref:Ankyrin repeat-containing domain protein n=1 Tax=Aspergillus cavernicola TaxID=176166 RepID=A0ABR4IZV0_9EURO